MKKYFIAVAFGLMLAMTACGPSASELKETQRVDSIRTADSLAMVQANVQRIADSIAKVKADSLAADSVKKCSMKKHK